MMPAGARCTPGFLTRPLTENERSPLRPFRPCPANHSGPFSMISRTQCRVSMLCSSVGTVEQPDLRDVGRTQPRLAALALDRFDHRGLFAADVGAGAAPQMELGNRAGRVGLEGRESRCSRMARQPWYSSRR